MMKNTQYYHPEQEEQELLHNKKAHGNHEKTLPFRTIE